MMRQNAQTRTSYVTPSSTFMHAHACWGSRCTVFFRWLWRGGGGPPWLGMHNAFLIRLLSSTHTHTHTHTHSCGGFPVRVAMCSTESSARPTTTGVTCRSAAQLRALQTACSRYDCVIMLLLSSTRHAAAYLTHRSSPAVSTEHPRLSATTSPSPR